jgi:hypothetical protein
VNHEPIAIDEQAASALIGVPVSSLQKMRMRGDGPPYAKLGNRVRYQPESLREWIGGHVVKSTSARAAA